jgi:hypothetical protein
MAGNLNREGILLNLWEVDKFSFEFIFGKGVVICSAKVYTHMKSNLSLFSDTFYHVLSVKSSGGL